MDGDYLQIGKEAAKLGGRELRRFWGRAKELYTKSSSVDLVTEADQASERAILEFLQRESPHCPCLSEEGAGAGEKERSGLQWVIDPLDGTTNYAHGYPQVAVSIALVEEGFTLVGVVYDPLRDELFEGMKGKGAHCNGEKLVVSSTGQLQKSLLATGFSYERGDFERAKYAPFCYLTHRSRGVRRGGSAALDLAYVAMGRLDGFWESGLQAWDMAAGRLLVQEAYGKITGWLGEEYDLWQGTIVASNGALHEPFLEALAKGSSCLG